VGSFQSIACVVSLDLSLVSTKGIGVFQNLLEAQRCSSLPSWVVDIQGLGSWQASSLYLFHPQNQDLQYATFLGCDFLDAICKHVGKPPWALN
jgi:hypothetical protein